MNTIPNVRTARSTNKEVAEMSRFWTCLMAAAERSWSPENPSQKDESMTPEQPSVAAQVAALPNLPMPDLWKLWDAHFARRPGTWSRDYVASRVAYKIQERAYGGMDTDIKRRLLRMGESQSRSASQVRSHSQTGKRRYSGYDLLPGTVLIREWAETSHRVTVTPEGRFELDGRLFKSLSAASRFITGTQWSGPLFFGLVPNQRKNP